jgi:hypothetical protein
MRSDRKEKTFIYIIGPLSETLGNRPWRLPRPRKVSELGEGRGRASAQRTAALMKDVQGQSDSYAGCWKWDGIQGQDQWRAVGSSG